MVIETVILSLLAKAGLAKATVVAGMGAKTAVTAKTIVALKSTAAAKSVASTKAVVNTILVKSHAAQAGTLASKTATAIGLPPDLAAQIGTEIYAATPIAWSGSKIKLLKEFIDAAEEDALGKVSVKLMRLIAMIPDFHAPPFIEHARDVLNSNAPFDAKRDELLAEARELIAQLKQLKHG